MRVVPGSEETVSARVFPPSVTLNRPGFRRHLAAINYGLGGGGYEHEALYG